MTTPRKPTKKCNLETLLLALRAALIARAADDHPHIAYGRLIEAAKAYWPELHNQLRFAAPQPQDVAVKRKGHHVTRPDYEDPLPPVRF